MTEDSIDRLLVLRFVGSIDRQTNLRESENDGLNAILRHTCETVIYYPAIKGDLANLAKEIVLRL